MPKRIETLRDKYKSTTAIYPKIVAESFTDSATNYVKSLGGDNKYDAGNFKGFIGFSKPEGYDYLVEPITRVEKDTTHYAELYAWGNTITDTDLWGISISYRDGSSASSYISLDNDGMTISSYNKDININTIGTAKLKINGVEYSGGGSSYLHCITMTIVYENQTYGQNVGGTITCIVKTTSNTPFTASTLLDYLKTNFPSSYTKMMACSGQVNLYKFQSWTYPVIMGLTGVTSGINLHYITNGASISSIQQIHNIPTSGITYFEDKVL